MDYGGPDLRIVCCRWKLDRVRDYDQLPPKQRVRYARLSHEGWDGRWQMGYHNAQQVLILERAAFSKHHQQHERVMGSANTNRTKQTAAPSWDGSKIPSQQGKVAVVTGGNSGLGFEAAKKLAEHGATVILACRSESLGKEAQQAIRESVKTQRSALPPPRIEVMPLDLGSFASIKAFAAEFHEKFDRLDLLINNAGVSFPGVKITEEGLDAEFGTNHIGHFYLTKLMIDLLRNSPAARVVTVTSSEHRGATMEFDTQGHLVQESGYGVSKLANLMFAYELERRLRASGATNVISVAVHPGVASTAIMDKYIQNNVPRFLRWLMRGIVKLVPMHSAEMGALPTLYAATVEGVQGMEFYGPEHKERTGYPVRTISSVESYDEEKAKKLWTRSEEITKSKFEV